jgi:hypothetical protein
MGTYGPRPVVGRGRRRDGQLGRVGPAHLGDMKREDYEMCKAKIFCAVLGPGDSSCVQILLWGLGAVSIPDKQISAKPTA